jgi:tetratricopeptide (TPR) repeat protein
MEIAVRLRPDLAESHVNAGFLHWLEGRPAEAVDSFRRALSIDPKDSKTLVNLGLALARLDRNDEALALFRQAVEVAKTQRWHGPPNTRPLNELGNHLVTLNQLDEAQKCFETSIQMNPQSALPWFGKSKIESARKNDALALAALDKAINLEPASSEWVFQRALVRERMGDFQGAIDDLSASAGQHFDARLSLSWMRATCPTEEQRNPKEAWGLVQQLQPIGPAHAAILDVQSAALAAHGRFRQAAEFCQAAIQVLDAHPQRVKQEIASARNRLEQRLRRYESHQAFVGRLSDRTPIIP